MKSRSSSKPFARLGALLVGCASIGAAAASDVEARYQELCASCHGERFSTDGRSFNDRTDSELIRIVREGMPSLGMPAFAAALSDADTAALVNLLRKHVAHQPRAVGAIIEAESLNRQRSGGYAIGTSQGITSVGYFNNGSHICYDDIDLTGVRSLELRYAKGDEEPQGRITVLAIDDAGTRINLGEKITTPTGGWETYTTRRMGLARTVDGVHRLCIVGIEGGGIFNLDKFALSAQPGTHDGLTRTFELTESARTAAGHRFRLERVADAPGELWSIDFLGPERIVAAQKNGILWLYERGQRLGPIEGTPRVWDRGQGGLHTVKAHPQFAKNGWIYLTYADPAPNGAMTRIVRGRLDGLIWSDEQTIYRAPADVYTEVGHHFGSRLIFAGEYLFFSIGDRGQEALAQDLGSPYGKIHRLRDDGTIPPDNPFVSRAGAVASIWSYGHRNPQGLAVHPITGELWAAEHGPRGGDEVNLIRPSLNYGWPIVSFGINYDGTIISESPFKEGIEPPRHQWTPSIAVSAIAFYTGEHFPKWRNRLLAGSLAKEELHLLQIEDGEVVRDDIVLQGMGRIRDVTLGPDGFPYVVLNHPYGMIYRIVPAS